MAVHFLPVYVGGCQAEPQAGLSAALSPQDSACASATWGSPPLSSVPSTADPRAQRGKLGREPLRAEAGAFGAPCLLASLTTVFHRLPAKPLETAVPCLSCLFILSGREVNRPHYCLGRRPAATFQTVESLIHTQAPPPPPTCRERSPSRPPQPHPCRAAFPCLPGPARHSPPSWSVRPREAMHPARTVSFEGLFPRWSLACVRAALPMSQQGLREMPPRSLARGSHGVGLAAHSQVLLAHPSHRSAKSGGWGCAKQQPLPRGRQEGL